ncbi:hypothetical protein NIES208_02675 [[Limnothrix rosea] IAM M-220]|nr:hypothetical protein NIES208_02675 [[Limnothrix rosea] IAM M-220]
MVDFCVIEIAVAFVILIFSMMGLFSDGEIVILGGDKKIECSCLLQIYCCFLGVMPVVTFRAQGDS